MSIMSQIQARFKEYRNTTPGVGVDLSIVVVMLTRAQWDSVGAMYKDTVYARPTDDVRESVLGGISVAIVSDDVDTGLWLVHGGSSTRIGEPFHMQEV